MNVDEVMYDELSRRFSGAVITSSRNPGIIRRERVGAFDYHCLPLPMPPRRMPFSKFACHAIRTCLRWRAERRRFDLVVTYDPLKTGVLGVVCARVLGARFVPEVNGVYTSPAQYLDSDGGFSSRVRQRLVPMVEGWVLGHADGVRLLFPGQAAPFERRLRDKPVAAFPCRVNTQPFLRLDEGAGKPQVLFAGFPFYLKGVDILIEAFKAVAGEYADWELKILGWYPDTRVLARAIDGHPRIFHQPPVYPQDMPQQIDQCSIFVLPSRSEAMGRVLVEAMAAAKACIGSDVEGIPEVIDDGVNGLLFPAGDVAALSARLRLLMGDAATRRRLGAAARDCAQRRFSDEIYFQNIEAFYTGVLGKGGANPQ